jgi:alpha-galactosidase
VSLGLKAVGYEYINIDDTWSSKSRAFDGTLVPDSKKWPNGIAAVATEIHGMGLKMGLFFSHAVLHYSVGLPKLDAGLYGDSGMGTCSGYPGSQGHEMQDAKTLAGWGIDFWKYDKVNTLSPPWLPFPSLL